MDFLIDWNFNPYKCGKFFERAQIFIIYESGLNSINQ